MMQISALQRTRYIDIHLYDVTRAYPNQNATSMREREQKLLLHHRHASSDSSLN